MYHPSVVFGVREGGFDIRRSKIKVAEINFQIDRERSLPIPNAMVAPAYHGAPFACNVRQSHRTVFQLDQVM